ncbi:MAG: hypothetical protein ACE5IL_08440 [Myxococcota bacterium]
MILRRTATTLLCLGLGACISASGADSRVELERFRGIYTTHFGGIPDRSAVCAVVANRSTQPIEWVRLRLESHSALGEKPARWVSLWLYRGRLAPGAQVSVELAEPPMADQIRLDLRGAGRGRPPGHARTARRVSECSEQALRASLRTSGGTRVASRAQELPVVRRNRTQSERVALGFR